MYFNHKPYILSALSKNHITWQVDTNEKVLFLTFDDGPIPEVTPMVVKILENYDAKASFFMVGENAFKNSDEFELVKNAGHTIGNHTFNHLNSWKTPLPGYKKNIEKAHEILQTPFFRPPYGKIRMRNLTFLKKDYKVIMWSVLSGDFDQSCTPQYCFKKIEQYTKNGSIIVMHDSLKAKNNMLYCLEKTLEKYSGLGYKFLGLNDHFQLY